MKKSIKITLYVVSFIVAFVLSALVSISITGSLPNKLINVKWNDSIGTTYLDQEYENKDNHKYDIYIPNRLDKTKNQYLILYIHGGSFNSGSKNDGATWCKYYATKGYITASMDYTLQAKGVEASLYLMQDQIKACVDAIKERTTKLGYTINGMATCGVSAGGTLAMNYAYKNDSSIPVKFVFQLAGPANFEPSKWQILIKTNKLSGEQEFVKWMTGEDYTEEQMKNKEYQKMIDGISPDKLVNETSVPTLIGYGLKDHLVPTDLKFLLIDSLKKNSVRYDYIEFPNSNHGMYADLDKLQSFLDKSIEYCNLYFK